MNMNLSDIIVSNPNDLLNTSNPPQPSNQSVPPAVPTLAQTDHTEPPRTQYDPRLRELKTMIYAMKDQLDGMLRVLSGEMIRQHELSRTGTDLLATGEQVLEGVFTGQKMMGSDGKEYAVPPNYASKSKLVEGDSMKLTITPSGAFIYKQISPVERKRLIGELIAVPGTDQWSAVAEGKTYHILTASVTFYKGKPGDTVVFLVPKTTEASWGAVEHIMAK